ncbi:ADAM10 [Mytilus edulis]|uniref:ADAM10 n=1 Tax=Mytilus edulis TaxID=6550 RepID=A0A8S3UKN8_MYTED|nr:ADAM10 [Mytilus edulis]
MDEFKLRYTSGLIDKQRRYRRAVDAKKKIYELYIQVDHTLFFRYNNVTDDVIANINNHVMAVNSIFNAVDFDSNSSADSIGFSIKRIKIHDDPTVAVYNYSGNHSVNSMLFLHSEENYDQFCLSYIFTHRDFDNGILGLAWTAEPGTSGGLCSRYTHDESSNPTCALGGSSEYSSATCGNKVVESGEDCDCGWDDDCTDTCCYPALSATGSDSAKACQYRTGATCR